MTKETVKTNSYLGNGMIGRVLNFEMTCVSLYIWDADTPELVTQVSPTQPLPITLNLNNLEYCYFAMFVEQKGGRDAPSSFIPVMPGRNPLIG